MTELLNLTVVSLKLAGLATKVATIDAAAVESRTGYLVSLLIAALVIAVLLFCGWMLVALGVRIGRSMERHSSLLRENSSLVKAAESLVVSAPATAAPIVSPTPSTAVDRGFPVLAPNLHREMVRDTLTGLWTRDAILDLLQREMSRATRQKVPFGLVLAKLDHFDVLKREKGEPVSDAVLKTASEHFVEGLREYDSAGRSGPEFLLILPGWDPDTDPKRVDGLLAPIRMKPGVGDEHLQVTASIGVASFHPLTDSPYAEDLLERADMAVHAAQAAGRNRAEFAPR